jgi:hypothetical protein
VLKRTAPAAAAGHLARAALQTSEWQVLATGTNGSIVAELKALNNLRVDAQGPNLTFSVNGQGAVALTDPEFAAGDFGFVLETHDAALAHIHFDVLTVRAFDPATVPSAPALELTPTPTATGTETPTATRPPVSQPTPTVDLTAFAGTAQAAGTLLPELATQLPGAVESLIPSLIGSASP